MRRVSGLLSRGNGKVGEGIHTWSLPALSTCVGSTDVCRKACYARQGRYRFPAVRARLRWNLRQCRRADWVGRLVREITRRGVLVVRVHPSGDFFSAEYVDKWRAVAGACPRVTFLTYTRSWRDPAVEPALAALAGLANVRLFYSLDADTGLPDRVPPGVRLCYLQAAEDEEPAGDLLFRVRRLRRRTPVGLPMACPSETPEGRARGVNCGSCQHCLR